MFFPFMLLILSEVALERFLTPRTIDRVRYGRECRDGFVFAWVF